MTVPVSYQHLDVYKRQAWKGVMAPSCAVFFWNMRPSVDRMARGNLRICKNRVRRLRYSPTPRMHTMAGTPHTKSLTAWLTDVMMSRMGSSPLCLDLYAVHKPSRYDGNCQGKYKNVGKALAFFFVGIFGIKKQTAWGRGCGASPPDRKRKIIRGETA